MRLWSLHTKYLDTKGLGGLWREALLAQRVLQGLTKGYKQHPQLERFKSLSDPLRGINSYLQTIYAESVRRGFSYNRSKIKIFDLKEDIWVTTGQVHFEWDHLMRKLKERSFTDWERLEGIKNIEVNPFFKLQYGDVESWEKFKL